MVQIYEQKISCSGVTKTVRFCCGDICESHESYDVLFCSAFRENYYPLPYTLIGSLFYKLGIPVEILAKKPFLDLKSMGCWMSDGLPGPFKRIGCVEILSLGHDHMYADLSDVMLKSVFSTFRFLLEQASYRGVCVKRVALPLLGSGSQQIEKEYIVVPMISQSLAALREIDSFEELTFFDLNLEKAQYLADCLEKSLKMLSTNSLSCFVSYSSKQEDFAQEFFSFLQRNNLSCWMAPNSIPSGSDYLEVIPSALNQISVLALLLTPMLPLLHGFKRKLLLLSEPEKSFFHFKSPILKLHRNFVSYWMENKFFLLGAMIDRFFLKQCLVSCKRK